MKKEKPSLALESTIGGRDVRLFVLVTLNRQKDTKRQQKTTTKKDKKRHIVLSFLSLFVVFFCPFLMSFLSLYVIHPHYPDGR